MGAPQQKKRGGLSCLCSGCCGPSPVEDLAPMGKEEVLGVDAGLSSRDAPANGAHTKIFRNQLAFDEALATGIVSESEEDVFFDALEDFEDGINSRRQSKGDLPAATSVPDMAALTEIGKPRDRSGSLDMKLGLSEAERNRLQSLEGMRAAFAESGLRDTDFCRILRARDWGLQKSSELCQRILEWREKYKPKTIIWDDIEEEFRTGKVYRLQVPDKHGRQVLVLSPGKQNTKNHVAQMQQLVYVLESCLALKTFEEHDHVVPPERTSVDEQVIILLDFTGYTMMNAPPLKVSLQTLQIFQECYCERLGEALLLNPPTVFRIFWKMIYPFLHKNTKKKIKFLPQDFQACDMIKERFEDLDLVDKALGGTGDVPYEHEKYAQLMKSEDTARALQLKLASQ